MSDELTEFIEQSEEILEKVSADLLLIEKNPQDYSILDAIFRGIHTIKGTAGFFGLSVLSDFAHHLEGMLGAMRNKQLAVTPEVIDLTLSGSDTLASMIKEISGGGSPEVNLELVEQFKEAYQQKDAPAASKNVDEIFYCCVKNALTDFQNELQSLSSSKTAPEQKNIDKVIDSIISFGTGMRDLFATQSGSSIAAELQKMKIAPITAAENDEIVVAGLTQLAEVDENIRISCLANLMKERDVLVANNRGPLSKDQLKEVEQALSNISAAISEVKLLTLDIFVELAGDMRNISENAFLDTCHEIISFINGLEKGPLPLGEILVEDGKVSREDVAGALKEQKQVGEILINQGKVAAADVDQALGRQKIMETAADMQPALKQEKKSATMRVDEAKIDSFANLLGELLVSRNSYEYLLNGLTGKISGDDSKEFRDNLHTFSRLINDMHYGVNAMRMVPIKNIFQKFSRIIRDIARKQKKQMELVFQGEETEIDKGVADSLTDPLIHLLRNAGDHGIESPAQRKAAGKDEKGTITLSACQDGGSLLIHIKDDGGGINKDKLTEKAVARGIDVAEMSEKEIYGLIFHAGITTMDKSSEFSGRGVGMDVVRTSIESLDGIVELDSRQGEGTDLTLTIPTSMGISTVLLVEVCSGNYGILFEDVLEAIKISPGAIRYTGKSMICHYRGNVIPINFLSDTLQERNCVSSRATFDALDEISLVIINGRGGEYGLIVDKFIHNIEMAIKPLPPQFADIDVISGASILGNGQLVLILKLDT